jgi:hypothetical protein
MWDTLLYLLGRDGEVAELKRVIRQSAELNADLEIAVRDLKGALRTAKSMLDDEKPNRESGSTGS